MHNCFIKIDNVEYLPVRAIPFCTSGQFDPLDVIHVLTDPESHSDNNVSANVVAYLHSEDNRLTYQPPNMLLRFENSVNAVISCNGSYLEQVKALPAKMLVRVKEMRSFHEFLINSAENKHMQFFTKCHQNNFTWCNEPHMTGEERPVVFEGFETLCQTEVNKSRKNGTAKMREKIELALEKIEIICNDDGIRFSRDHVPGQKSQLLECLKLIDRLIQLSLATFDGPNYIGKLNLKWKQGERKECGLAMVDAIRKAMGAT